MSPFREVTLLASQTREGPIRQLVTCRDKSFPCAANKQKGLECLAKDSLVGSGEPWMVLAERVSAQGQVSVLDSSRWQQYGGWGGGVV